jgi:flagellar hook-length control protein FliK
MLGPTLEAAVGRIDSAAAPLDLRQDRWPSAMIERIERLRDDANAADTRIRLVPDALGEIGLSVSREGETVSVRFTAEQAATRALLQDVAPRLAEAAEARGVKLGQTSVEGGAGTGGGGSDPQRAPPAPLPAAPASARAAIADEDPTDTRIA